MRRVGRFYFTDDGRPIEPAPWPFEAVIGAIGRGWQWLVDVALAGLR